MTICVLIHTMPLFQLVLLSKTVKELSLSQLSDYELKQILPADEYAIFNMVVLRTLAAFYAPAEYAVTTRTAQSSGFVFQTTGKVLKSWGWLVVYGGQDDDEQDKSSGCLKLKRRSHPVPTN